MINALTIDEEDVIEELELNHEISHSWLGSRGHHASSSKATSLWMNSLVWVFTSLISFTFMLMIVLTDFVSILTHGLMRFMIDLNM